MITQKHDFLPVLSENTFKAIIYDLNKNVLNKNNKHLATFFIRKLLIEQHLNLEEKNGPLVRCFVNSTITLLILGHFEVKKKNF